MVRHRGGGRHTRRCWGRFVPAAEAPEPRALPSGFGTPVNVTVGTSPSAVIVAAGDVNGDGYPDVVCAAGPGGAPNVRVFDGRDGTPLGGPFASFFPYDPAFSGGAFVAAGDVNGDGLADVITGAGPGGGPDVK